MCEKMSAVLSENMNYLNDQLKVNQNFDVVYRVIRIGGREACMYFIDGFCKDELMQRLAYNGTMQRQLAMYQQYALALTQKYEPDKAGALMESITGRAAPGGKTAKRAAKLKGKESGRMERARSSAYNAALPGGGR